jgi:hypothetical protein
VRSNLRRIPGQKGSWHFLLQLSDAELEQAVEVLALALVLRLRHLLQRLADDAEELVLLGDRLLEAIRLRHFGRI